MCRFMRSGPDTQALRRAGRDPRRAAGRRNTSRKYKIIQLLPFGRLPFISSTTSCEGRASSFKCSQCASGCLSPRRLRESHAAQVIAGCKVQAWFFASFLLLACQFSATFLPCLCRPLARNCEKTSRKVALELDRGVRQLFQVEQSSYFKIFQLAPSGLCARSEHVQGNSRLFNSARLASIRRNDRGAHPGHSRKFK
jgi:hypothetical protein